MPICMSVVRPGQLVSAGSSLSPSLARLHLAPFKTMEKALNALAAWPETDSDADAVQRHEMDGNSKRGGELKAYVFVNDQYICSQFALA